MSAILFDLDGTLTDPREGITRSIAYALGRLGIEPPPLEALTFAIGPPLRASLAALIGTGSGSDVERALAFYRERFADVGLFENRLYDGIPAALDALGDRETRLFVATSKPEVYATRIVRHFGLEARFAAVHGCELDGRREDKRDLLDHLVRRHALEPGRAVMVGDRANDMLAARHHGIRAVGALWAPWAPSGATEPARSSRGPARTPSASGPSPCPKTWPARQPSKAALRRATPCAPRRRASARSARVSPPIA